MVPQKYDIFNNAITSRGEVSPDMMIGVAPEQFALPNVCLKH
jgi:hypothetical protein